MSPWLLWAIAHRLAIGVIVGLACLGEFNADEFRGAFARWPQNGIRTLSSRFAPWDAAHYLVLSQSGYEPSSPSCAFFPLWPAAIRAMTPLSGGSPLAAALLLANGLSLAVFWLFYDLMDGYEETTKRRALILLLAFPGALFFVFPYTESLYLMLVLIFFRGLRREAYLWPTVVSFLMPLAKAIGVFIVLAWAWHLFEKRKPAKYWLLLLGPLLGYALYFGFMYLNTGNAAEGFDAQKGYPYSPSIKNMFHLSGFLQAFLSARTLHGMMDSALDRGFFLLFLALLPWMYRLNRTWFLYVLPAGLVPALTSYFMSYRRYLMVCFPAFIVLAQFSTRTKSPWVFRYYLVLLALLQAWAVKNFVNFNWAG